MTTGNHGTNIAWQPAKVTKQDRQRLNGHGRGVVWFTGLSGAGKSTLSAALEQELCKRNIRAFVLDGDNIRHGLNNNLGFSPDDRKENIRRIGEVSKLFAEAGLIALTACISPYREDRDRVRSLMDKDAFIEVYVKCALEECERRDPKGLYRKARSWEIAEFTGISAPYEEPPNPEITVESDKQSVADAVGVILGYLLAKGLI